MNNGLEKVRNSLNIVITGGTQGIGLSLAQELKSRGHCVYTTSRDLKNVDPSVYALDLNSFESIKHFAEKLTALKIDILINNAGTGFFGPLVELDPIQVREQFQVNVFGQLEIIRQLLPRLKDGGVVVNMSSISSELNLPFGGIYSASKAAFDALSEVLRLELFPLNIKVINVKPGQVKTNFIKNCPNYPFELGNESLYINHRNSILNRTKLNLDASDPAILAKYICNKILKKNPPLNIYCGKGSKLFHILMMVIPSKVKFLLLLKKFGLDRNSSPKI